LTGEVQPQLVLERKFVTWQIDARRDMDGSKHTLPRRFGKAAASAIIATTVLAFSPLGASAASAIDPANMAFGYADKTGMKLLALGDDDNTPLDAAHANALVEAVCANGQALPIRYLRMQQASPASNGRQSDGNFTNEGGPLFEVTAGRAEPDDTCMLVPADYTQAFPVIRNDVPEPERQALESAYWRAVEAADERNQPVDVSPFHAPTDFAKKSLGALEKARDRAVKLYWPLFRSGSSQEVAAIEFAPEGDSLLGTLVLVEAGRLSFPDMPASLKKGLADGGCWSVDDECRFDVAEMNVPAVLGKPGEQLIFFTTESTEGQFIRLLQVNAGKLVELKHAYRYRAT